MVLDLVKIRVLRNDAFHCVFIRLHGNIFSNLKTPHLSQKLKADHKAAEHFVCQRGPSTNHSRDEPFRKYADWLRSINHAI